MAKMKCWEIKDKKDYKDWLNFHKFFTLKWLQLRVVEDLEILEDETVNSIVPLSNHSKRSGKFEQHTYLVCYSFKLKYGYCLNTKKHFKFIKSIDLKQFRDKVSTIDSLFNTIWIKDSRYGKRNNIEGFLNSGKRRTMKIERLFSGKKQIYANKKNIKTQTDLENTYHSFFKELSIIEIQ